MNAVVIPPRFEDLYPEESETLVKICNDNKYSKLIAHLCDFIQSNPFIITMKNLLRSANGALQRDEVKIGRNDPCPCGKTDSNGKPLKHKKCCL